MLDVRPLIVDRLSEVLPTYYEQFLESAQIPCISYMELEDTAHSEAGSYRYSEHYYTIKIYASTVSDIARYSEQVDKIMYDLNTVRTSSREMTVGGQIIKILNYSFLTLETE